MPDSKDDDKTLPTLVSELWELVVRYAKQETVEPLQGLLRFVGFGLAGAVLLAMGAVVLGIGVLRVVQQEAGPHLSGHLSWVPYTAVVLFGAATAGLLGRAIGADKRRVERERLTLEKERG